MAIVRWACMFPLAFQANFNSRAIYEIMMNGIGTRVSAISRFVHSMMWCVCVPGTPFHHWSPPHLLSILDPRLALAPSWNIGCSFDRQTDGMQSDACLKCDRVFVSPSPEQPPAHYYNRWAPPSMERTPLTYLYNRQQINFRFRRQFAKCIMKIYYATAMGTMDSRLSRWLYRQCFRQMNPIWIISTHCPNCNFRWSRRPKCGAEMRWNEKRNGPTG